MLLTGKEGAVTDGRVKTEGGMSHEQEVPRLLRIFRGKGAHVAGQHLINAHRSIRYTYTYIYIYISIYM